MTVFDDNSEPIDATFSAERVGDGFDVPYESRGPRRNTQYAEGLDLVLGRLARQGAVLTDGVVESKRVEGLPDDERRIQGVVFSVNLGKGMDVHELRLALSRGKVARRERERQLDPPHPSLRP